jgi:hypothetical protein
MSKKTTIYISDSTEAILTQYGEGSLSGTISTLVERYNRITADSIPEFTENEWCLIADCLNGCGVWVGANSGIDQAPMLWAEIMDSAGDGIGEKWGVSPVELGKRLRTLPLVSRIAAWDVAARFWASPKLNDISTRDLLVESGARII